VIRDAAGQSIDFVNQHDSDGTDLLFPAPGEELLKRLGAP
jgi:hypothetical protein